MVKKVTVKEKAYFQCEICMFYYQTKELAQQCEDFCKKHKSCSLDITKHAATID